jgi:hypothetical protein
MGRANPGPFLDAVPDLSGIATYQDLSGDTSSKAVSGESPRVRLARCSLDDSAWAACGITFNRICLLEFTVHCAFRSIFVEGATFQRQLKISLNMAVAAK